MKTDKHDKHNKKKINRNILSDFNPHSTNKQFEYIVLPPKRKKVAFVFFVVESLSKLEKNMSITKLLWKIGFEIFPDFEVL